MECPFDSPWGVSHIAEKQRWTDWQNSLHFRRFRGELCCGFPFGWRCAAGKLRVRFVFGFVLFVSALCLAQWAKRSQCSFRWLGWSSRAPQWLCMVLRATTRQRRPSCEKAHPLDPLSHPPPASRHAASNKRVREHHTKYWRRQFESISSATKVLQNEH